MTFVSITCSCAILHVNRGTEASLELSNKMLIRQAVGGWLNYYAYLFVITSFITGAPVRSFSLWLFLQLQALLFIIKTNRFQFVKTWYSILETFII